MALCICYIANTGYLFQTLLSALQAAAEIASPSNADHTATRVAIFNIGHDTTESTTIAAVCQRANILFKTVDPDITDHRPITFTRFYLDRFVPDEFDQLLYLDGDTQIAGRLGPLLTVPVHGSEIFASRDPQALLAESDGAIAEGFRARLEVLGIPLVGATDYVNAGMLRVNRDGWAKTSRLCLAAYDANPAAFKFYDQDAINLICRDDLRIVSFKWNYPGFFDFFHLDKIVTPNIVHFMSNPRPWQGPLPAFRKIWRQPYVDLLAASPDLRAYCDSLSPLKFARYVLQQKYVRWRDREYWTLDRIGTALARAEANVVF